jgi:hypothetical protein
LDLKLPQFPGLLQVTVQSTPWVGTSFVTEAVKLAEPEVWTLYTVGERLIETGRIVRVALAATVESLLSVAVT